MWTQQADVFAKYFRNLDTPQGKNVLFTNFDAEYPSLFYIFTPNKEEVDLGELCTVCVINGRVDYKIREAEYTNRKIHQESFEEAVQIVEEQEKQDHKSI